MDEKHRKPEWVPRDAGKEFATRVLSAGTAPGENAVNNASQPRRARFSAAEIAKGVTQGNRAFLARAITLIESNSPRHFEDGQELVRLLLPASGNSVRIGITGTPGAGKSTFIESFGIWLIERGHKVAVLAIDPSSSLSLGSILGDKTRMEKLGRHPNSFIRPSPSGGALGGVARKTRESMIACEAAGYDVILIETVGVGQSETTVRSMVDFFLLMQISGAGDELQGIKKGIMELADLIAVNKADGDNILPAQQAAGELNNALHYLRPATPGWTTRALTCSALENLGLDKIWDAVQGFLEHGKNTGIFAERRQDQVLQWFESLLTEAVLNRFNSDPRVKSQLPGLRDRVQKGELPVLLAVKTLLDEI
ncbi:MAG: methylmalonyl Co-A mutase-associated GTPase MeaB [Candidatus Cloacimonadaceae bacterium]|jgi:LAO/AO transport system kinase|nr:methylmalonyl Co-A mutase-associated GTPase MeaB [Candidatus Cloacimonadota bacterium]MDX9949858.1 methylmalonyl Co-A mutase-associated GTPase MeaB [Candidatus Syntrophosphaera sp.]